MMIFLLSDKKETRWNLSFNFGAATGGLERDYRLSKPRGG